MPINIVIGLVALLVALIMYSIGAFGAFHANAVNRLGWGMLSRGSQRLG